ncbi:DUF2079 domain-containing protein [Streptomyces sp. NPDC086787]|uniref:DUF2079 domain-containing protein n=1 Tax=Streptomyces sp. NPDC086787 TaxID=3365759 RepID=UPI0037FBC31B
MTVSTTDPSESVQSVLGSETDSEAAKAGRLRITWWMWTLTGALFFLYTSFSFRLHERLYTFGFDLGVFEQAVRSYAHGHWPVSEVRGAGFPVLGDHFSPILALVAPFYDLWPTPKTLMVVQAALIASSVLPLVLWTRRRLGDVAAAVIGGAYGLSWGVASALQVSFHEVAFAVPLITCSLISLVEGRLRRAALWALPLILVKEDLGMTAAVIGGFIIWRGSRKLGVITVLTGLVATIVALLIVMPALNTDGGYNRAEWLMPPGGHGFGDVLYRYTVGVITPEVKSTTLLLVLAPTLGLAMRSPLILIALPNLLGRFVANYDIGWGYGAHHSLVLMPIVFIAFVDALERRRSSRGSLNRYLMGCAAITLLIFPQFALWAVFQPATWKDDPHVAAAQRMMALVPDNVTVQATNTLVPHLSNRTSVSIFGWAQSRPNPQWLVVDTAVPLFQRWPYDVATEAKVLEADRQAGYTAVGSDDGVVVLKRSN